MPGLDHDIHPSVRIGKDWRYGCWNRKRPNEDQIVRSLFSGAFWSYIFSTECRFDMSLTDPACEGCEHRGSGEKYDEMIRRKGT